MAHRMLVVQTIPHDKDVLSGKWTPSQAQVETLHDIQTSKHCFHWQDRSWRVIIRVQPSDIKY